MTWPYRASPFIDIGIWKLNIGINSYIEKNEYMSNIIIILYNIYFSLSLSIYIYIYILFFLFVKNRYILDLKYKLTVLYTLFCIAIEPHP